MLLVLDWIGPLIGSRDAGPALFRLSAGGTAVLFDVAYISVAGVSKEPASASLRRGLKYWAFAIRAIGYSQSWLSVQVLALFGYRITLAGGQAVTLPVDSGALRPPSPRSSKGRERTSSRRPCRSPDTLSARRPD